MNMKKILVLCLVCVICLTGCGKNDDTLIMVTEAGFAPYEYYDDGEIVGVDIDIAREIAKEMGKELVVKDVAFDSIINEVKMVVKWKMMRRIQNMEKYIL